MLPGDSILSLEANTELQLGMYTNGILIAQWSGRAFHHVESRSGSTYAVQTPFYTAVATGTDFYTFVDRPVQGAISKIYGDLMVKPRIVRDRNGNILGEDAREIDVVGVAPADGTCLIFPYNLSDAELLKQGDYYVFRFDQARQTGKKTAPPARQRLGSTQSESGPYARRPEAPASEGALDSQRLPAKAGRPAGHQLAIRRQAP